MYGKVGMTLGALMIVMIAAADIRAQCVDCQDSCPSGHRAGGTPPPESGWGVGAGTHSHCVSGSCLEKHGPCGGTFAALAESVRQGSTSQPVVLALGKLVKSGENAMLAKIVRQYSNHLVYYAPRGSLQLLDCRGQAVANYRLDAGQVVAIAAVAGRQFAARD